MKAPEFFFAFYLQKIHKYYKYFYALLKKNRHKFTYCINNVNMFFTIFIQKKRNNVVFVLRNKEKILKLTQGIKID